MKIRNKSKIVINEKYKQIKIEITVKLKQK